MNLYFPPPGGGLDKQARQTPEQAGLRPAVVNALQNTATRWALWRHGRLVHVKGEFDLPSEVFSLRKTWHALTVGAALKQNKIPSLDQKISVWLPNLKGSHADATWRHVLTQSAGFDYPYGRFPAYKPGEMWTYSDLNLVHLCDALAKVYGRKDFHDHYETVPKAAYLDAIGMEGWSTSIVFDPKSQMEDGVRLHLSLEHLGRLGLLILARGAWNSAQLIPPSFIEALETKQTRGMKVNYNGPNDGSPFNLHGQEARFPEAPYGFLTWTNTDGDHYPGADRAWAWGAGAGGHYTLWNRKNGIVYAAHGRTASGPAPHAHGIPHLIEANLL